ncbi:MAG TPA: M28 family peptidase [Gemmatimonadales bacterium]|nr:M28 family peptidase [Gemmatimonadales bacterium]
MTIPGVPMRLTLLLTPLLAACQPTVSYEYPQEFDGQAAHAYVARQMEFGHRIPGTEPHAAMAAWLEEHLRGVADEVVVQRWNHTAASGAALPMVNVIARFRPELQDRILYLAHWDTRPISDAPASSDPTAPMPGANDGGSGVAILLGVADALRALPAGIGVDLLFVDGEDYGDFGTDTDVLIGSKYYAQHQLQGPRPRFAVLFDIVGHEGAVFDKEGYSVIAAPRVVDLVWEVAAQLGYQETFVPRVGIQITDDHVPLQRAGIAAIDIIGYGNYEHWHTPDDTLDKISAGMLQIVGDVAMAVLRREGGQAARQ